MSSRLSIRKIITGFLVAALLMGTMPATILADQSDDFYGSSVVTVQEESGTVADFVERLYTVALGRPSETKGKEYWVKEIESGNRTGGECGIEFLCSEEFNNRNLSIENFVEVLYKTFFDRASEPKGKAFWVSQLKENKMTRQAVILGFIDSTEWCNVCASYGVRPGAPTAKAEIASKNAIAFATRLYTCCLKREPEEEGLKYWSLALTNLEKTGAGAAQLFFELPEFIALNTDDTEYVTRLYTTFMGRDPDDAGLKYWVGRLKEGTSRREVMAGFAVSPEFTEICKKYGIERGEIDMNAPLPDIPKITPTPTSTPTATPTSTPTATPMPTVDPRIEETKYGSGPEEIKVYAFSPEINSMIDSYLKLKPDMGSKYTYVVWLAPNEEGVYQEILDNALTTGIYAPDIYTVESGYVLPYTQGSFSDYAASYSDLIDNVEKKLVDADIMNYTIQIGTSQDGRLVGLGFQSTGGAFIYRRSLAKEVFGSDDPSLVENAIGAGSGTWDKFWEAAEALKEKGYSIVSGAGDIWNVAEKSAQKPWVVDEKLYIDPSREAFLDYYKTLVDNDYSNLTEQWSPEWNADMRDEGGRKVFGYFGPAWLINFTMSENCGDTFGDWAVCSPNVGFWWGGTWLLANKSVVGSDKQSDVASLLEYITLDYSKDGLQYKWANGALNDKGTKDTVASGTVMKISDGSMDFLGGQNPFDIFVNATHFANGKSMCLFDNDISWMFMEEARSYALGEEDKETALKNFKARVEEELGIKS